MSEDNIGQVATAIHSANKIAILTGAGVSKESGVPTFRDAMDGWWAKYDPMELATPMAFQRNPKLVWDWYQFRRELVSKAKPNSGHYALAEIQKRYPRTKLITQNVDDLHEQAGSTQIIHLHGNLAQTKCFDDCQGKPTIIDLASIPTAEDDTPPNCPHCGAYCRPNVVWFHEMLPQEAMAEANEWAIDCDVMIVVGTSGLVMPAASLPQTAKNDHNSPAKIIEVNPDQTTITPIADIHLQAPSGEILPIVIEALDKLNTN